MNTTEKKITKKQHYVRSLLVINLLILVGNILGSYIKFSSSNKIGVSYFEILIKNFDELKFLILIVGFVMPMVLVAFREKILSIFQKD